MSVRILIGDCREKLRELADASVNCCVTSPPYFGLRDYGTAQWEGGSTDCDHLNGALASSKSTLAGYTSENIKLRTNGMPFREECGKCGATRIDRQMGLEPTPDEFVAGMVGVFREVRRVLRDDGTLWLNIGDSYSTHAAGKVANPMAKSTLAGVKTQEVANESSRAQGAYRKCAALPEKNLLGIPWRLAFALQADGWILRQDIIWSKPNPMPESVRDRCTKAHEYLFLLSKSQRYYFDSESIAEPIAISSISRLSQDIESQVGSDRVPGKTNGPMKAVGRGGKNAFRGQGSNRNTDSGAANRDGRDMREIGVGDTRNKRSVWEVATQSFSEAHFATYPPALIEPCVLAGCPKGGTVLDPFGGAGTTGLVADRLGRNAILIELNPEYAAIAERRIQADSPMFAQVEAA